MLNPDYRKTGLVSRSHILKGCLLIILASLTGCAQLFTLFGIGEPRFKLDVQAVSGLPVVTREAFALMLADRQYGTASSNVRERAMVISAALNEPEAYGIDIDVAAQPIADASLLVVARILEPGPTGGKRRIRDFYLAAVSGLRLPVGHSVAVGVFGADGATADLRHSSTRVECMVLPGPGGAPSLGATTDTVGAGVAAGVRINAESALPRVNGAGQSVELHLFPAAKTGLPSNRFICARAPRGTAVNASLDPAGSARWPAPISAALISEAKYRLWTGLPGMQQRLPPKPDDVRDAARLVAAANHFDARAIEGSVKHWWSVPSTPEPSLLIVARDLSLEGDRARATDFFVVPKWWDGPSPWPLPTVATGVFIDFGSRLPLFDPGAASCGPLLFPSLSPICELGACGQLPNWLPKGGDIGGERLMRGLSRATLQWQVPVLRGVPITPPANLDISELPTFRAFDVYVAACSMFLSPPRNFPKSSCGINEFTGLPYIEQCNGLDDNCDGQVDEGNVCDMKLQQQCPPQPVSCGAVTCATIPDGCGNVIKCGGPCQ